MTEPSLGCHFYRKLTKLFKVFIFCLIGAYAAYFKLFPSVCLAQLWVLVCLKQAVSLIHEKTEVSRLLPPSVWQPSQNVPVGGRREGRKETGRRESFSVLLQKTSLVNTRSKILQGLMEGKESFISRRGQRIRELIIMKIMLRNTYNSISVGMTAGLRSCSAFHLHEVPLLFSTTTLVSWL